MTAERLLDAYPECREAVAWTELIICDAEPGESSSWDEMTSADPPCFPEEVRGMIAQVLDEEVAEAVGEGHGAAYLEKVKLAAVQTDHPSFLNYIRGKMGAY